MKHVYYNNFIKYYQFTQKEEIYSFDDVSMSKISKLTIPKKTNKEDKRAVVMFGFSGNGKTTWINNFCYDNPDYIVLSMDSIVNDLGRKLGRKVNTVEILAAFSEKIDEVCSKYNNVIVDGDFLNLFTRMALVDSLHTYDFKVTLVDITPIFDITIKNRIMSKASEKLGVSINEGNEYLYKNDKRYQEIEQEIINYYSNEKESSGYEEQKMYDVIPFGIEEIIVVDKPQKKENLDSSKKR